MIRAGDRFRTSQSGIDSWHSLSAGPHYDPARLRVGPFIGIDEHVIQPGAGFAEHAHRGVDTVSWVVAGTLTHHGESSLRVRHGDVLIQRSGHGIRHAEVNDSRDEPLRLVQTTLSPSAAGGAEENSQRGTDRRVSSPPTTVLTQPPIDLGVVRLVLGPAAPAYVYVVSGSWRDFAPGDFAYVTEPPVGEGELLSWSVPSSAWTQWNSEV